MKKQIIRTFYMLVGIVFMVCYFPKNTLAVENSTFQGAQEVSSSISSVSEEQYLSNIQGIGNISGKDLIKLVCSDANYFLFIGYKECPYCREFSKVLAQFKIQSNLPIYYINLDTNYGQELTDDEFKIFKTFLDEKIGTLYTPMFVRIEHQNLVSGFIGSATTIEQLQSINH